MSIQYEDIKIESLEKIPFESFHVGTVSFKVENMAYTINITNEGNAWHTPRLLKVIHEHNGYCLFCEKRISLIDECDKWAKDAFSEIMKDKKIRLRLLFELNARL